MEQISTYQESIAWLFSRFPSYQNLGAAAYKPGLERVFQLLDILDIDAQQIPSIHVAGTNGKGSTAAYCTSLLIEQGYKVGLFTSPHIYDFSERIRVNGLPISEVAVIDFCQQFQNLNLTFEPSFFELTFAMALAHFQAENCDYIVIETGLGGRLDATNVITPKVSVITNIALDHQDLLGETIEKIAFEKAGIIKAQTPLVIGNKTPATQTIFQKKASLLNAPIYFSEDIQFELSKLPILGYQKHNFNTALLALQTIGFTFSFEQQLSALENLRSNTGFFGRFEVLEIEPKIIIDVSHNPAGITATLPLIQNECKGQLSILYGAAKDKDASEILALFPSHAKVAACIFSNPRSKNLEEWQHLGVQTVYDNLPLAMEDIKKLMQPNDLLWITGSFFLISDLPTEKKIF
jgi:dihydrofolate synthase/folylpolyglutamate synthase